MKKTQIIVEAVLGIAVIVLFVLVLAGKSTKSEAPKTEIAYEQETILPVAYVNLDSVMLNYQLAIDANDKLMSKQEDARVKLSQKAQTFQKEYEDFNRKLEYNAFQSRERAEQEAAKLEKKQQELQELDAKLGQEIMLENQNLTLQLTDSLMNFIKEFNADGRYGIIFSNTAKDNILLADPRYDITAEVVAALNARYSK